MNEEYEVLDIAEDVPDCFCEVDSDTNLLLLCNNCHEFMLAQESADSLANTYEVI